MFFMGKLFTANKHRSIGQQPETKKSRCPADKPLINRLSPTCQPLVTCSSTSMVQFAQDFLGSPLRTKVQDNSIPFGGWNQRGRARRTPHLQSFPAKMDKPSASIPGSKEQNTPCRRSSATANPKIITNLVNPS